MPERPSFPSTIAAAVDLLVDSLDALAVIILVAGESDRSWATEQVAERLRMPVHVAGRELERLCAEGVAVRLSPGPLYLYAPADPTRAAAVDRLVDFHASRRVELINHVASRSLDRARTCAAPSGRSPR